MTKQKVISAQRVTEQIVDVYNGRRKMDFTPYKQVDSSADESQGQNAEDGSPDGSYTKV